MPQDQWPPVSWRPRGSVRRMPLPLTISKPKALIDGIKWAYLMKSTGICRMSSYQRLLFVSLPHRYSDFGRENKKTFSFYGYKLQDSLWNFSWVAFKLLAAFVWVELVLQLLNRCLIQLFFSWFLQRTTNAAGAAGESGGNSAGWGGSSCWPVMIDFISRDWWLWFAREIKFIFLLIIFLVIFSF